MDRTASPNTSLSLPTPCGIGFSSQEYNTPARLSSKSIRKPERPKTGFSCLVNRSSKLRAAFRFVGSEAGKAQLTIGRFLTLMAQFIEDEGISEERGWYGWLSCVKNRAKFKMPYSPICDEYLRHIAEVIKGGQRTFNIDSSGVLDSCGDGGR